MRVVAGAYRGRRIEAPAGRATRPTSDRVREALFSILGPIEGVRVLDLFAGSGALGIEALSRGAAEAVFVESDARAAAAVRRNLDALGIQALVHRRDAFSWLASAAGAEEPFDLVFADPPYSSASRTAGRLSELLPPVLTPTSVIVTESDKRDPLELALPLVDERTYGDTRIAIHRGR
ncbi:MAG: rRNA (guanine966-N2)-methyltransferase [Thermoleophilaceae bacterium]|nr:rRNA (guanine966-N2)-methyltransferase [Thermoleophilaceae bacterium]